MNNFIFVYITNPTREEAKNIASYLIENKLIACANIFGPINSVYSWEGKIVDEEEFVLIAKTIEKNFENVKREVEKIHSYKVPCIIKVNVAGNKKFFEWLNEVIKTKQE